MNLEALHNWLYESTKHGPETVVTLINDITILRQHASVNCDDLPRDGISLQEALAKLEIRGKAVRVGAAWKWAEPAAKPEPQRSLF